MLLKTKRILTIPAIFLIFLSVILFTSCGSKDPQDNEEAAATPVVELPTATPLPPDRAVLVAPAGSDESLTADAQAVMSELCAASGLEFETRQEASESSITADVKIMVFLYHPDNLGSLAANAPNTQFAAISDQNWNPPSNVTIIRTKQNDVAFLSGYIAAILAPNYRVGALLASEDTELNDAFQNGMRYYCGICASSINPLNTYPVFSMQPAASAPETWQAAFDEVNLSKVNVLYLSQKAMSPQLASYLSGMDVTLIGSQTPIPEAQSRWAASIYIDSITPLREIWDDMLAGIGGQIVNASIKIDNDQPLVVTDGSVWLSPGKMVLVNKMITLMREDQIGTQPIP